VTSIAETYCLIGLEPSIAQLACVKTILGERLDRDEAEVTFLCTGRRDFPKRFQEATGLTGRKGGKTEYVGAPILVHRSVTDADAPGTYLLCAPSKSDQARRGWEAINRYLATGFPNLIDEVSESEMRIQLHNGNDLKIASANFRNLRGPKYKVVVVDEACFFMSDSPDDGGANPLGFILDSVVGGMVATEHPLLLLLSTPWTKAGIVFENHRDRALNTDTLVWQAPTLLMFPGANQALMARHRKDRGEDFYQREYMAQFSEDAIAYIEAADIDAAISEAPFFLPKPGMFYHLGLDPGRKRDHFGAAVAHAEAGSVIVDWCREWKPGVAGLKYADILPEIWARAREYRVRKIASDQIDFGGIEASIPRDGFGAAEFELERVMTGGQSGAELADTTRALFAQRKLVLPNQPGLADEFKRLADYLTVGGGRDVRAKRGADDRSRAIMLAVHQSFKQPHLREPWSAVLRIGEDRPDGDERFWHKLNN
jgi:hypothetical protein